MAHDPQASPRSVLRRYQVEIWNQGEVEKLAEIVANPYRRHYPGKIEILTNAQLAERVRFYRRGLTDVVFHSILEVADGPYVTTAWETLGTTRKGQRLCTSGIEIFKVEGGLITDVWNGHAQDGQFAWNLKWDRPVRDVDFLDVQERVKDWGIQTAAE
jgi:SnoaL-like polyketide cyclase